MLLLKACLHQHPFTYNKRGLSADFELSSPLSKSCDKVLIQEVQFLGSQKLSLLINVGTMVKKLFLVALYLL